MYKKIFDLVYHPSYSNPEHILLQRSAQVLYTHFSQEIRDCNGTQVATNIVEFIDKMFDTMECHEGLGLAAVQVGVPLNIIVINSFSSDNARVPLLKNKKLVMINPRIIENSNTMNVYTEGCLSFGNIYPSILRPRKIIVKYLNLNQETKVRKFKNNILVSCIQHEIDHTEGKVFLDRVIKLNERCRQLKKYFKWRNKQLNNNKR